MCVWVLSWTLLVLIWTLLARLQAELIEPCLLDVRVKSSSLIGKMRKLCRDTLESLPPKYSEHLCTDLAQPLHICWCPRACFAEIFKDLSGLATQKLKIGCLSMRRYSGKRNGADKNPRKPWGERKNVRSQERPRDHGGLAEPCVRDLQRFSFMLASVFHFALRFRWFRVIIARKPGSNQHLSAHNYAYRCVYTYVCIYIYVCCEVINWATFGGF